MYGYGGNDDLVGAGGADIIYGGADSDDLRGGGGNDDLYGEGGNDTLRGQDRCDELWGGDNGDVLYGGDNNLNAGISCWDTGHGGAGPDNFYDSYAGDENVADYDRFYGGDGNDGWDLLDGDGIDRAELQGGNDGGNLAREDLGDYIDCGPDEGPGPCAG